MDKNQTDERLESVPVEKDETGQTKARRPPPPPCIRVIHPSFTANEGHVRMSERMENPWLGRKEGTRQGKPEAARARRRAEMARARHAETLIMRVECAAGHLFVRLTFSTIKQKVTKK